MTKPNSSEIICVVDRSGSMSPVWNDTIGGLHKFVQKQRELPGDAKITITFFDTEYDIPFNGVDVRSDVFDSKSCFDAFSPRGWTALYDAIGKTMIEVGNRLNKTPENERPDKVVMCIVTDGGENASKEFHGDKIKEMIQHQTDKYQWDFVYLGANQDAFQVGGSIGIATANIANYNSHRYMRSAWNAASSRTYASACNDSGILVPNIAECYASACAEQDEEEKSNQ